MTDEEILAMYHGFNPDLMILITKYVKQFHKPWPLYGPKEKELINYCIDKNISIDDLPKDDAMIKKYYDENIIY